MTAAPPTSNVSKIRDDVALGSDIPVKQQFLDYAAQIFDELLADGLSPHSATIVFHCDDDHECDDPDCKPGLVTKASSFSIRNELHLHYVAALSSVHLVKHVNEE